MLDFNFNEALEKIGRLQMFQLANEARPASEYLFNTLLPEVNLPDYHVEAGSMRVIPTMAGLTAESSEYAKTGVVTLSTFLEETAKLSSETSLSEGALRKMQAMLEKLELRGGNTTDAMVREVLNFLDKVIIQSHMDSMEYLRSKALVDGKIDWTYGGNKLSVDYNIPSGNKIAKATGSEAYDASSSTFWEDIALAMEKLDYNVRAIIAHPTTCMAIMRQQANNIEVLGEGNIFRFQRLLGNNERPSRDSRDFVEIIAYGLQGAILNPADPKTTIDIDFMPVGKILLVGNNTRRSFRVGEGATPDPILDAALGYTHIGPTVEGSGAAGRWARIYSPEERPWQIVGQGVTNGLPVIEAEKKIAILETEIGGS